MKEKIQRERLRGLEEMGQRRESRTRGKEGKRRGRIKREGGRGR